MKEVFCTVCGRKINTLPFIGERYHQFKDGYYCDKCAKIKVEKNRRKIN